MDATTSGKETYYDILHVQQNAPLPIIKNAYRALMHNMKSHPDLGGDSDRAALINLAYDTLKNATKRAAYDQSLNRETTTQTRKPSTDKSDRSYSTRTKDSARSARSHQRSTQSHYAEYAQDKGVRCAFCYKFQATPPGALMDCSGCGSPLDPILTGLESENAVRSIARIEKDTIIRIQESIDVRPKKAQLQDMSPHGVGFICNANLTTQQVVKITAPDFGGLATIVHRRENGKGNIFYGAQFVSLRFSHQAGNFISTSL